MALLGNPKLAPVQVHSAGGLPEEEAILGVCKEQSQLLLKEKQNLGSN